MCQTLVIEGYCAGSLDANRDAYGQGDVDAASMNSSVQEITSVLNENSEQLEQDIDALVRFADAMESLEH